MQCHLYSSLAFSLFIDVTKLDKAVSNHLGLDSANDNSETKVTVCPYEGIWDAVKEAANNGARIWVWLFICICDGIVSGFIHIACAGRIWKRKFHSVNSLNVSVHTVPQKFENGSFTPKTHQLFSIHTMLGEFKNESLTLNTHQKFSVTLRRRNLIQLRVVWTVPLGNLALVSYSGRRLKKTYQGYFNTSYL